MGISQGGNLRGTSPCAPRFPSSPFRDKRKENQRAPLFIINSFSDKICHFLSAQVPLDWAPWNLLESRWHWGREAWGHPTRPGNLFLQPLTGRPAWGQRPGGQPAASCICREQKSSPAAWHLIHPPVRGPASACVSNLHFMGFYLDGIMNSYLYAIFPLPPHSCQLHLIKHLLLLQISGKSAFPREAFPDPLG